MVFHILIYLKWSDTEYDPSVNLNLAFDFGAGSLDLFVFLWAFYIFPCVIDAKIWNVTFSHLFVSPFCQ